MVTFLITYALTLLLALLMMAAGGFLLRRSVGTTVSAPLLAGGGYFVGMALFLSVFRTLGMFLPAPYAMAAGLAVVLGVATWSVYRNKTALVAAFRQLDPRFLLVFFLVWAFVIVQTLLKELPPLPHAVAVYDSFGSLHSGRYANLATYIVETKSIPLVNQNYGQSLLAATLMMLGAKSPFLALHIWLSLTKLFFWLTMYGFLRHLGLGQGKAGLGSALIYMGNTALSFTFVLVNDSGYPALLVAYTDTLSAMATIPVLAVCFTSRRPAESFRGAAAALALVLPALFGLLWQMASPQNALLLMPALAVPAMFSFQSGRRPALPNVAFALTLFTFFALGALQGGMLAPKSLLTDVQIPGMMQAASGAPTTINPHYPAVRLSVKGALFFPGQLTESLAGSSLADCFFAVESNFWMALRMAFFPIFGFVLAGWLLYRRGLLHPSRIQTHPDPDLRDLGALWMVGTMLFVVGFCFAFPISYHGYKWELARFLLPGYLSGMLLLAVTIEKLELPRRATIALWGFVLFFAVGSVLHDHFGYLPSHFFNPNTDGRTFWGRLELLTQLSGTLH